MPQPRIVNLVADTWTEVQTAVVDMNIVVHDSRPQYYVLPLDYGDAAPTGAPVSVETGARALHDSKLAASFNYPKAIWVYAAGAAGKIGVIE